MTNILYFLVGALMLPISIAIILYNVLHRPVKGFFALIAGMGEGLIRLIKGGQ